MLYNRIADVSEEAPHSASSKFIVHLNDPEISEMNPVLFEAALREVLHRISNLDDMNILPGTSRRTRQNTVEYANAAMKMLGKSGEFPRVEPFKRIIKRSPFDAKILTLGELVDRNRVSNNDNIVELQANAISEATAELSETRLNRLRLLLEREFASAYEYYKKGRYIISDTSLPSPSSVHKLITSAFDKTKFTRNSDGQQAGNRAVFTEKLKHILGIRNSTELTHVVVRQINYARNNLLENAELHWTYTTLHHIIGPWVVQAYLEPTTQSCTSAFGILLIDTAFNVSSLEDLHADPFVGNAQHGRRRVTTISARKMRAKGRGVEAHLLSDGPILGQEYDFLVKSRSNALSSLDVLAAYSDMASSIRPSANAKAAESFWIVRANPQNIRSLPTNQLVQMATSWWPTMMQKFSDDPVIGGVSIARANIRPTVIQVRTARAEFDHVFGQALANHSDSATTMRYLSARWLQTERDRQMRGFLNLYEAAMLHGIPGASSAIGLTPAAFDQRSATALATGLDFYCEGERKQSILRNDPRATCRPEDPCASCPLRSFQPSTENFERLHLMDTALKLAETDLTATAPERWLSIWLPWRALTAAFVNKINSSPYKAKYSNVVAATELKIASGALSVPIVI